MNIQKTILYLFPSFLLALYPAPAAMASPLDASIIKEALAETVCPTNIEVMVKGSDQQDSKSYDESVEPQRHFETKALWRSYRYMKGEQTRALNYAASADEDPEMRTRTLFHFGMLLHTSSCFYRNTSFLKEQVDRLSSITGGDFDPYSIDLFDWRKLGESGSTAGLRLIDRDSRGALLDRAVAGTTMAKVARGLAIREARRQWDLFETLIRNRYHGRADTILAALKSASCPSLEPPEEALLQ